MSDGRAGMGSELRLGRVLGFPVALNWSVLVIVLLLAWGLAAGVLPDSAPGHPAATYWTAGVAGAVLLVLSLLAHELAHAVLARRAGVGVTGLTLWMFGGIASLEGEPPDARADLRIAIVGPLVSAALGVLFGAAWFLLRVVEGTGGVVLAVTGWLATINVVLAVFNLVPGAPLDGGRVLRALLWRATGDRERAAATAARAGEVVATALIALGVLLFLGVDPVGGLWMALIGWFVLTAAGAERRSTVTGHLLAGVRVGDIMSAPVQTLDGVLTVEEATGRLLAGRHSAYAVTARDGTVVGLVTLAQMRAVPPPARDAVEIVDGTLPLAQVATCGPDLPVVELIPRLTPESGRRALVFEDGWLVGIVTPADITRSLEIRRFAEARAGVDTVAG